MILSIKDHKQQLIQQQFELANVWMAYSKVIEKYTFDNHMLNDLRNLSVKLVGDCWK